MKQVIEKFIHRICEEIVMGDEADNIWWEPNKVYQKKKIWWEPNKVYQKKYGESQINLQETERRQAITHQKSA